MGLRDAMGRIRGIELPKARFKEKVNKTSSEEKAKKTTNQTKGKDQTTHAEALLNGMKSEQSILYISTANTSNTKKTIAVNVNIKN